MTQRDVHQLLALTFLLWSAAFGGGEWLVCYGYLNGKPSEHLMLLFWTPFFIGFFALISMPAVQVPRPAAAEKTPAVGPTNTAPET